MKFKNKAGYTIVELLIVVSVSAAMAVSAFALIQGQQIKNEFTQSSRDFDAKVTDIANDVSSGYYLTDPSYLKCQANQGDVIKWAGTVGTGASPTCSFGGKVIEFNPAGIKDRFSAYTLAVRKYTKNDETRTITSLGQLSANDIDFARGANNSTFVTEQYNLLYGLEVVKATHGSGTPPQEVQALVFLSGFSSRANNNPTLLIGAPITNLYWINKNDAGTLQQKITNPLRYNLVDETGITICAKQGGGNGRVVFVNFGQDGRQLTTTTTIDPPASEVSLRC